MRLVETAEQRQNRFSLLVRYRPFACGSGAGAGGGAGGGPAPCCPP